jgi:hypothetical protein
MPDRDIYEDLRARLHPLDVAGQLGLRVKSNYFECPHDGCNVVKGKVVPKAQAFDDGHWRCCKCEAKGDAVELLQIREGLDKGEATERAKYLAGLDDDRPPPPPPSRPDPPKVPQAFLDRAIEVYTIATDHYDRLRREGDSYLARFGNDLSPADRSTTGKARASGLAYLNGRGIAPLVKHRVPIGLAPSLRTGLLIRLREWSDPLDVAVTHGLAYKAKSRSHEEAYRGRVWLPWQDDKGNTLSVKGRAIPDLAAHNNLRRNKEDGSIAMPMKSPRTTIYGDKFPQAVKPTHPFGWAPAIELLRSGAPEPLLIVEGEIDALSAMLTGYPAVATGGSSGVGTTVLAGLLDKQPFRTLVLFDRDDDDETRARVEEDAQKLAAKTRSRWVLMPEGDLNDQIQLRNGGNLGNLATAIEKAVHNAHEPPQPKTRPKPKDKEKPKAARKPAGLTEEGQPDGWAIDRRDGQLMQRRGFIDGQPDWEGTRIFHPPSIVWRGQDLYDGSMIVGLRGRPVGMRDEVDIAVPRAKLKVGRDIVPALASVGLDVQGATAKNMVAYLSDYERDKASEIELRLGSTQMGWHRNSFLYGEEVFGPDRIAYIGGNNQLMEALGTGGTMNGWINGVLRPLERHSASMLGMYASFAAPVLRYVPDINGFCVEYAGDSSPRPRR